jgi:tetratricopeptide (TPR) repeat protein
LLGELGRGGMGVVYQARQVALNRLVALKVIRMGAEADAAVLARFRVEAEAVARLQHPHIVQIYEIGGLDDGSSQCPFMALELVPGGSLAAKVNGTPLPPGHAAELVETVAQAIHFAHQHGILHRDLKPANVLLTADGTPKVTDFGLAKRLEEGVTAQTRTGAVLGTPGYMAPEQGAGTGPVGVAADVYALGAILYECLTGRAPFRGATPLETLEQTRNREPVPPSRLQPKVPRDLEVICLKCLEKEPRHRYGSAADLAEDLGRFRAGRPIRARPAQAWERLGKWARRRPAQAALVAVTAAAGAVVLAVVLASNVRLREQRNLADERRGEALANLRLARSAVDHLLTRVGAEQLRDVPQMEQIVFDLLKDAREFYQGFVEQAGDDPEVLLEACRAYRRVGDQYSGHKMLDLAEACHREALALLDRLPAAVEAGAEARRERARCTLQLSKVAGGQGRYADAADLLEQTQRILKSLADEGPDEPRNRLDMAVLHGARANLLAARHASLREQEEALLAALELLDDLVRRFPDVQEYQTTRADARNNWAVILDDTHRHSQAEEVYRENSRDYGDWAARFPTVNHYRSRQALSLHNLAILLDDRGQSREAAEVLAQAVAITEGMARDYPSSWYYQYMLGFRLRALAELADQRGEPAEARPLLERAILAAQEACRLAPETPGCRQEQRKQIAELVDVLIRLRDYPEATRRAEELPALRAQTWQERFQAAILLARCAAFAEADTRLGANHREALAGACAAAAVRRLREAVRGEDGEIDFLNNDPALAVLRSRMDFRELLAETAVRRKP